ncbi:MAG: DUF3526 domain-containing protein [Acidobacteria bacterium]|nr:DUF3526 domain-containing protein [Acidobacteriota bacterium]
MTGALVKLELLRLRRSRAAWAILAFALFASFYSVWSGVSWRESHSASLVAYEAAIESKMDVWLETLAAIESGERFATPFDARPSQVEFAATHPVGPLGHLAVGSAELLPARANIGPLKNQNLMVERYGFENPTTLTLGRFDLAFLIVVVLPLLMIALSFDVIAADRSRGTISLLLASRASKQRVIATRLLVRNGILVGIVALAVVLGIAMAPDGAAAFGLLWSLVFLAYSLFWIGLIYLVVGRTKRSETSAAVLVSLWALFTFAAPALANSAGEALYPLPSNLDYLSDARVAQNDAWKRRPELTARYLSDHPELVANEQEAPEFAHAYFLANVMEIESTAPIVAAFEESHARRSAFVDRLQFTSPAIVAQRALFRIAGSDFDRTLSFLTQARAALTNLNDELRPVILASNRMSTEDFATLSGFEFKSSSPATVLGQISIPVAFLVACLCLFVALGRPGNRYSPFP